MEAKRGQNRGSLVGGAIKEEGRSCSSAKGGMGGGREGKGYYTRDGNG